ncbi:MAG: hypothetical protein U0T82_06840 [Bacteroidales bacterium]
MSFVKPFFTGLLLLLPLMLQAQKAKEFPADHKKFPEELATYMKNNLNEETGEELNAFFKLWEGDSVYTPAEKDTIIRFSNLMLKANARPTPHFLNFIRIVALSKTNQAASVHAQPWRSALLQILTAKKITLSRLDNFLENTYNLLGKGALYQSSAATWKATSSDFSFVSDGGIRIVFPQTNLVCYALRDSMIIERTSGWMNPLENIWNGKGGVVTWERAGLNRNDIFAELNKYTITLSKISYEADSVNFTNKQFFENPMKGSLKDQVKYNPTPEAALYPEFQSYEKTFFIKNIYENMNYEGGLTMRGSRLVGSGNEFMKAHLYLYRNDTLFMDVNSKYFAFRKDRAVGQDAGVSIKFRGDSIYHSDMTFTYYVDKKEVSITHSENYGSQSPWFNSYQGLDMTFDQLYWKSGDSKLTFTMNRGASIGNANFKSKNFFNYSEFASIQGVDPLHPLVILRKFVQEYFHSEEFLAGDLAAYMRLPVEQVRIMLLRLSAMGFVYYNIDSDVGQVKQKLYDYLKSSIGRIDYDVIDLRSRTTAPQENARLDLRTFDLTLNGIPAIALSDSQNVIIYPANGTLVMKRDRSFQFDGVITAGLFTFFGNNFFFDYNNFKINLQKVDSVGIRVISGQKDNFGMDIKVDLKNLIQNVTGEILIDDPGNKSGVKSFPEYPVFKSTQISKVYYDNSTIQGGVYRRESFYFDIDPYTIDSLDNFRKEDMKFTGTFISAGIFPDLRETLAVQPDYSLGFDIVAPEEGLPLYGGKGRYYNSANMSNRGLKGDGLIAYITSETRAKDINFYPDSVNTMADNFEIHKQLAGTQYPDASAKAAYIHWLPKQDKMLADSKAGRFNLYNPETKLAGTLELSPSGLSGKGHIDLTTAEMISNLYDFNAEAYHADTSEFHLKSLKTEGFTVRTSNVKADIDFSRRQGRFSSNSDFTLAEFPENRYISYIDEMVWKMDERELDMTSDKKFNPSQVPASYKNAVDADDNKLVGARYISTQKGQDSLSFVSPLATYNYEKNLIKAQKVTYIKVADANIKPFKGNVTIGEKADMFRLDSAQVLANRITRYHLIHSASLKITGRNAYTGTGFYDYIDENKDKQLVRFGEVEVDSSLQTIARGEITEPDDFTLSPDYAYQGKVMLFAQDPVLTFKGSVRLNYACENVPREWIYFTSRIFPDSIYIPIGPQPVNINRINVYDGMFLTTDSIHIYSAFFAPRKNYSDRYVSTAQGYLYLNKDSGTYLVGPVEKLANPALPGNLIGFNRNNCRFYGRGKIDLGIDLGRMKLSSAGSVMHDIPANQPYANIMLTVDFSLYDKALEVMAQDFDSLPGKGPLDLAAKSYNERMDEMLGLQRSKIIREEIGLYGKMKEVPPELMKTFVITDLHLKWNDVSNSYQSYGLIGLSNIGKTQVNKYVEGFVEIYRRRSGDLCDIYLKADDKTWYYFGYTREVMQSTSTNSVYKQLLQELKAEQRTIKAEKGIPSYIYMIASDTKIGQFLRHLRQIEEGANPPPEGNQEP